MKKLFGKVLVGAIGCVMALGLNAFAANEINITKIDPNKDTGKVIIEGTITGDAASPESTILVAPENTSLIDVNDGNIKYIDQETVQSGTFKYEFVLEKGAKYNVWFGGTDVVKPGEDVIDLTSGAAGTFKIVGTVSLIAGADATKVTAKAGEVSVNAAADGTYTLEVAPGTYDVVVGRAGYLYRTFSGVEVTNADKDLGATALIAGNTVDTEGEETAVIDLLDLQKLLNAYRTTKGSEGFVDEANLNDDEVIDLLDLQALLNNYRTSATAYAAE